MTPPRREWPAAGGPEALAAELAETGIAWRHAPHLVAEVDREPWTVAERLLGERPLLLERQPIRPMAGGRSFASGNMAAPFHTDSQAFLGVPPHLQLMACRRAAARGGENLYLDAWALLARIEREDPELLERLFDTPRRFPFVFGDVFAPTVALRAGCLVFTHTSRPLPGDPVARRLEAFVTSAAPIELRAEAGDVVVIHNHRLLHGRRAFVDPGRVFTRLLVWRAAPGPAPAPWTEKARSASAAAGPAPLPADVSPEVRRRLAVVLELLRGVAPGALSAREGVSEPELYRWRDAVLGAGTAALSAISAPGPAAGPAAVEGGRG
jgi:hypothetical protein